jgi:hypothetical protein
MSLFKINNINMISSWGYNLSMNTECTICRCNLNENSLFSQEKGIDSDIIDNICGHYYHVECINPWILKYNTCPLCAALWVKKK